MLIPGCTRYKHAFCWKAYKTKGSPKVISRYLILPTPFFYLPERLYRFQSNPVVNIYCLFLDQVCFLYSTPHPPVLSLQLHTSPVRIFIQQPFDGLHFVLALGGRLVGLPCDGIVLVITSFIYKIKQAYWNIRSKVSTKRGFMQFLEMSRF